jgi:hypothetical protein
MTKFVVSIHILHNFLIEADSEEQAEERVTKYKDLGLDLSGYFEIYTIELDSFNPNLPYRTLSTE